MVGKKMAICRGKIKVYPLFYFSSGRNFKLGLSFKNFFSQSFGTGFADFGHSGGSSSGCGSNCSFGLFWLWFAGNCDQENYLARRFAGNGGGD